MSTYNITALLNNRSMEKIALELWTSEYDVASTFMECSSAYKMLVDSQFDKLKDAEISHRFYKRDARVIENYGHHMFQFKVWKRSMQAKFVVEALFLFFITVTLFLEPWMCFGVRVEFQTRTRVRTNNQYQINEVIKLQVRHPLIIIIKR